MREVKDLAAGMKDLLAGLRKANVDAKGALMSEVTRAQGNAKKVQSVAADLREANKEVEEFLGETGSNFPPSEDSKTPQQDGHNKADINGVTVNREVQS
jgi:hypothetical protein